MFANGPGNLPVNSSLFKFALSTERMYCKTNKQRVQKTFLKAIFHRKITHATSSKSPSNDPAETGVLPSYNPIPTHSIKTISPGWADISGRKPK